MSTKKNWLFAIGAAIVLATAVCTLVMHAFDM